MRRFAVASVVAIAAVFVVGSAQGAGAATPVKPRGQVTGAAWVFPGTGGKLKGTSYGVTAVNAPCSFAKQWAVKLSGTRLSGKTPGKSYPITGGPKGYACNANPDANGKLLAASCKKGSGASTVGFSFGGAPKRP